MIVLRTLACSFLAVAVIATASAAVNTPAPAPNSQLTPVRPHAENGPGQDAGVYLPPIAGPQSEIMGTVVADQGSGPTEFYVA